MSRAVKLTLAANLLVLTVLAFVYPNLMVGPGKLIPGHHKLEGDCFACHQGFRGATAERCTRCHKPVDIGRVTTTGIPVAATRKPVPFHQKLVRNDCVGCHSDHAGVKRFRPQGRFDHALLLGEGRSECETCHRSPGDSLHRQITANCGQCHTQKAWKPATFDHRSHFVLDRDHAVQCATCHTGGDFRRYTCYGCHEHTPERIRREHREERIVNFDNCVECHPSANERDIRRPGGPRGGGDRKRE